MGSLKTDNNHEEHLPPLHRLSGHSPATGGGNLPGSDSCRCCPGSSGSGEGVDPGLHPLTGQPGATPDITGGLTTASLRLTINTTLSLKLTTTPPPTISTTTLRGLQPQSRSPWRR